MKCFAMIMLSSVLAVTSAATELQAQCSGGGGSGGRRGGPGGGPSPRSMSGVGTQAFSANSQSPPATDQLLVMRQRQMQQQANNMRLQAYRQRALQLQAQQQELLAMRRERADHARQARRQRAVDRIALRDAKSSRPDERGVRLVTAFTDG